MKIDATNKIVGRVASFAAKQALLGNKVHIVNAEKAVFTGRTDRVYSKFKTNQDRGEPFHGPFISRMPDRLFRRIVRGMLPFKQARGREAFRLVLCHIGEPKDLEKEPQVDVQGADVSKVPNLHYVTVGEISKLLGAKL